MPVFTLDDLNRPKSSSTPLIGRRFTDWRPKPAPPKTKPAETDKVTTKDHDNEGKTSSKRKRKTVTTKDHENDNGDDEYMPPEQDEDSASDASSVMSVDVQELDDGVIEKEGRGGKVIRSRGPVQDYTVLKNAVVSDESWIKSGRYFEQQMKAMLAEQKFNADAEVNDPNVPTVECDAQGEDDEDEASYGLQRAPDQTLEEFLTSMTPDFVYRDGNKIYSPAYKKAIWKEPHKGENGTVEWKATAADQLNVYPDGSIALRRRFDLEASANEGMRPNKKKRVEEDGKEEAE